MFSNRLTLQGDFFSSVVIGSFVWLENLTTDGHGYKQIIGLLDEWIPRAHHPFIQQFTHPDFESESIRGLYFFHRVGFWVAPRNKKRAEMSRRVWRNYPGSVVEHAESAAGAEWRNIAAAETNGCVRVED